MAMENPRLYYRPEVTAEVLRTVIKGATTQQELSEEMGVAYRTVHNRVHDPIALGFLTRNDSTYEIIDKEDVMKYFQLEDKTVFKSRFVDLPGVKEVRDELDGGQITYERIGRLISYHTNSDAIEEETFITYGRVYANWFNYLRLGYAGDRILYSQKPPGAEREVSGSPKRTGSGYPRVRPEKVFRALPMLQAGISDKEELSENFDFSDRYAGKLLSTCYSLGLASRTSGVIQLTDFGEKVLNATEEERKRLIRESLLQVDLIKEYYELAPDGEFRNQKLMQQLNEELDHGWSESTVKTKAKRIYSWLKYSDLFKEPKQGYLIRNVSEEVDKGGQVSLGEL
jgi:hypothetical protein